MTTAVEFKNVDIIFGDRSAEALAMRDEGQTARTSSRRPVRCWAQRAPT